jgi:hypothetical protein
LNEQRGEDGKAELVEDDGEKVVAEFRKRWK